MRRGESKKPQECFVFMKGTGDGLIMPFNWECPGLTMGDVDLEMSLSAVQDVKIAHYDLSFVSPGS